MWYLALSGCSWRVWEGQSNSQCCETGSKIVKCHSCLRLQSSNHAGKSTPNKCCVFYCEAREKCINNTQVSSRVAAESVTRNQEPGIGNQHKRIRNQNREPKNPNPEPRNTNSSPHPPTNWRCWKSGRWFVVSDLALWCLIRTLLVSRQVDQRAFNCQTIGGRSPCGLNPSSSFQQHFLIGGNMNIEKKVYIFL